MTARATGELSLRNYGPDQRFTNAVRSRTRPALVVGIAPDDGKPGSLGRALTAPQGALDHVALPKLDPNDPPITQTRALTRVEPGPQITPFECLNDLLDEPLVVQRRKQQGTLPRLERETSALPWGLVVHRIHRLALLMGDMFDGNLGANSTEDAGPKATDF